MKVVAGSSNKIIKYPLNPWIMLLKMLKCYGRWWRMKKEYIKLYGFMVLITLIVASLILVLANNVMANRDKRVKEEQEVMDKIGKA